MFTPEDVLVAYEKHGLKPIRGTFNADIRDGKIVACAERCCPLTVMAIGEASWRVVEKKYPGLDPIDFYRGFDGYRSGNSPSFFLGREVAAFLEREGWL